MEKIIVIGAGASGLVAAISTKSTNNEVIILEKNNICGKKILVTGNGKCNYFNEDFTIDHYRSNNIDILSSIINDNNKDKILDFFNKLGILPKIKNNYYYPNSNQAITIREALVTECNLLGIKIKNNIEVLNMEYINNQFIINTNEGTFNSDKVILSTGSCAAPKTGSDGFAYKVLKNFNHSVITPLPALTPLTCIGNYFKEWTGIRTDAKVTMIENNKQVASVLGELQLTTTGISGICVFQLSGRILKSINGCNKTEVSINFLPTISNTKEDIINYLDNLNTITNNRTISGLLDGLLNYKLVNIILKLSNINRDNYWAHLSNQEKNILSNNITNFILEVEPTNDFEKCQVTQGGIPLSEININTMESLLQPNLYLTGELLDVDGDCGGYNLAFAWLSGLIAGSSIKENNNAR